MRIAVVIPSFRGAKTIQKVIAAIGPEVEKIYVIDDCCPEQTGRVAQLTGDNRVKVIFHSMNQGVGGATCTGYKEALQEGMDIIVKIDCDGQMDPRVLRNFTDLIENGQADYTKGNRFYKTKDFADMPFLRLIGNAALSFMTKFSSGYWHVFDPTNGFTAIYSKALAQIEIDKISKRYFFETDLLFRLYLCQAVVVDVPMESRYGDEKSGLKEFQIIPEFLTRHLINSFKRLLCMYFVRSFSVASIELIVGPTLLLFGTIFGLFMWKQSIETGITASSGTVMLAALPVILGFQMIFNFLSYDMGAVPKRVISRK